MKEQRRLARKYLNEASTTSFWHIVYEAKIGDADQEILDLRFVHGWAIGKIAQELNYSPEVINSTIKRCYDKVARLLAEG